MSRKNRNKNNAISQQLPQPKGALPFIGHLHLLGGKKTIARTLGAMADECGPIYSLRLGQHWAIVLSSREMVKDWILNTDAVTATRPPMALSKYFAYNYASFAISPYGKYWRDIRKIATVELLSARRLEKMKHLLASEVNSCINHLQAIVKETLRLYPPSPLTGPREALEDCHIDGHFIPKGTRIIVDIWKVHRDPRVWARPDEFRPERFLDEHGNFDFRGQNFEYIPFSLGRRACPGMNLGLQVVHLELARLVQGFDIWTEDGGPVDMSEGLGLAMPKATPLNAILAARLPIEVYDALDYLKTQVAKPQFLAGPAVPLPPLGALEAKWERWLSKFPEKQVIFCNFGSETYLNEAQIEELALGLELTNLPFFLVLNFGTSSIDAQNKLKASLPEGFIERVRDRGVVHTGWVQQQHILAHKSVGCYLNHSGFSSVIEAIVNDCQLAFVPQKGDQFFNSKLLSGDLRIGVEVNRRDEDGYFGKEDILKAIKTVMVDTDKEPGRSIRENHKKWKDFFLNKEIEDRYLANLVNQLQDLAKETPNQLSSSDKK